LVTQEHLEQWLNEIQYCLRGIDAEIDPDKINSTGIPINGKFVSFSYLLEKTNTISNLIDRIKFDMENDK